VRFLFLNQGTARSLKLAFIALIFIIHMATCQQQSTPTPALALGDYEVNVTTDDRPTS